MTSLFKGIKALLKTNPRASRTVLNEKIGEKNLDNDLTFIEKFRIKVGSVPVLKDRLLEDKLLNEAEKKVLPAHQKSELREVATDLVSTLQDLRKDNEVVNLHNAGVQMIQKKKDGGASPEDVAALTKQIISLYPSRTRKTIVKGIDKELGRIEVQQHVSALRSIQVELINKLDLTVTDKLKFFKDPEHPGYKASLEVRDMSERIMLAALKDIADQDGPQSIIERAMFYNKVAKQCVAENDFDSATMLRQAVRASHLKMPNSPDKKAFGEALDRDDQAFSDILKPPKHCKLCKDLAEKGIPCIPNLTSIASQMIALQEIQKINRDKGQANKEDGVLILEGYLTSYLESAQTNARKHTSQSPSTKFDAAVRGTDVGDIKNSIKDLQQKIKDTASGQAPAKVPEKPPVGNFMPSFKEHSKPSKGTDSSTKKESKQPHIEPKKPKTPRA